MRDYLQIVEVLTVELKKSNYFSHELTKEFLSYAQYADDHIVANVSRGGSPDDSVSAAAFVSFMCMINQHLYQIGQEEYFWLIRKSTDVCWEYGRKFHQKLIGEVV